MTLKIEQANELTIIRIMNDSIDAVSAREIAAANDQMQPITIMDFGAVMFINSAGISALLKLVIEARKQGKKLYAVNVTAHHRKVFEMVDMLRYMPIARMEDFLPARKS
ncbi:MAG: STAS domain-containing protein [Chloroflexi bacterium]|uniref:STAS domain-containing protein n=1 Tax=Candidatus Chlorohelix allophototropha TaxID=3003348 RepID=A0A8T7M051_9CHLR|nr:STAS domain-containing protein [Chloroflexota bacterium]WJW66999.1 STAS domain-containing protein [Chloroflexota bacterium L227-S17]